MTITNPHVVETHTHPQRLHTTDCWHSEGPYRPATNAEKGTLPECYHCARAEGAKP